MSIAETSLVVPWRPTPEREPLWEFVRQFWSHTGIVDEIVECDSGQEPFTRGTSINRGVEDAAGDILILADADTFVSAAREAVYLVRQGAPWVIGYGRHDYFRVDRPTTEAYIERQIATTLPPSQYLEQCVSYSGCVVLRREAFERVGGFDERMVGWGAEDMQLFHTLESVVGQHERPHGFAVQLYHLHDEAERFQQPHFPMNEFICNRYRDAAERGPEVVKGVIREWKRDWVPVPIGG